MHRSGLISALARRRAAIFTISPIVLCGAERCPTAADTVVAERRTSALLPRNSAGCEIELNDRSPPRCVRSPSLFFFYPAPDFPIVDQRRINQLLAKQALARDAWPKKPLFLLLFDIGAPFVCNLTMMQLCFARLKRRSFEEWREDGYYFTFRDCLGGERNPDKCGYSRNSKIDNKKRSGKEKFGIIGSRYWIIIRSSGSKERKSSNSSTCFDF